MQSWKFRPFVDPENHVTKKSHTHLPSKLDAPEPQLTLEYHSTVLTA